MRAGPDCLVSLESLGPILPHIGSKFTMQARGAESNQSLLGIEGLTLFSQGHKCAKSHPSASNWRVAMSFAFVEGWPGYV